MLSLILSLVSVVYMTKTNGFKGSLCVEVMTPQEGKENPSGRYQLNPVEVSWGGELPGETQLYPRSREPSAPMYKERKDDPREILLSSSPEPHPHISPRFPSEPQ